MILPDFILPSRVNQCWEYSGIDSFEHCFDKKHFKSYPYKIEYKYNSRGFRDQEWPETIEELKKAIWCIGDSFTVGLGSPLEHTWPYKVSECLSIRTINVSMDGASNYWIARKAIDVIKKINPEFIIIQWSYIHRAELNDPSLNDEDRRLHVSDNFQNTDHLNSFIELVKQLEFNVQNTNTKIIYSYIPKFGGNSIDIQRTWNRICGKDWPPIPSTLKEFKELNPNVVDELINFFKLYDTFEVHYRLYDNINYIPEIEPLDKARDGHHYDILTADHFATSVRQLLRDRFS